MAGAEPASLDAPTRDDGATLGATLVDEAPDLDPHEHLAKLWGLTALGDALRSLNTRERHVLELRYGLGGGDARTLAEVGEELGLTRERVRQIQASALKSLAALPGSESLRDVLAT